MSKHDRLNTHKKLYVIFSVVVLLLLLVGTTVALILTKTKSLQNTFTPAGGSVEVNEEFDGETKKNVNVTNTGDFEGYVRIQLVSYRIKEASDNPVRIGGMAPLPDFEPGDGWLDAGDGLYIYSLPVAAGEQPAYDLIGEDGITLQTYTDDDGGIQVVDVVGELTQSTPVDSVKTAWKVNVSDGGVISLKEGA